MTNIWIIMLFSIVALILIMVGSIWYMNMVARFFIGTKHHDIEYIINTGQVPYGWSKRYEKKIKIYKSRKNTKGKTLKIENKAYKKYTTKINQLIKYVKTTNLVENEYVRTDLLDQLNEIKSKWERGNNNEYQNPTI